MSAQQMYKDHGITRFLYGNILVRAGLSGDFNGDNIVNDMDIVTFIGVGAYNSGPTAGGTIAGDINNWQ